MRWRELEKDQPRLAARARQRLVEPGVLDGRLLLSMMWGSQKARDLMRDSRVLVHSIVTAREGTEGELKLRGRAVLERDFGVQESYAAAVGEALGWRPEMGRFHLFEVEVEHVACVSYDHQSGDQHVTTWPPGQEFVRRGTGATTVGEPEPVADLLVS
jgi:hypothetical protein